MCSRDPDSCSPSELATTIFMISWMENKDGKPVNSIRNNTYSSAEVKFLRLDPLGIM
jgi:hypothetical protein